MVRRKEKDRAVQFMCDKLEEAKRYDILLRDTIEIRVREKDYIRNLPRSVSITLPNFFSSVEKFRKFYNHNIRSGIYTAPVFYKDGETAFARLVERHKSMRNDKSLKLYGLYEIHQMVHLRAIEKEVLDIFGNHFAYYQPEQAQLGPCQHIVP